MAMELRKSWKVGYTLLMIPPFIGLATILFEVPRWLEIVFLISILALVFFGSRLFFWGRKGWQPSSTLRGRSEVDDEQ